MIVSNELKEMVRQESIEMTLKFYVTGNAEQTSKTLWDVVKKQNQDQMGDISKVQNKPSKP